MNKRWIVILAGVVAFFVVLGIGAMAGGTLAFLALKARPVQAALALQGSTPDTNSGLLVAGVDAQGPAAQAGIVRGDILLSMNDQTINTFQDLQTNMAQVKPGDVANFSVLHGDETRGLSVTLGDKNGMAYLGIMPCLTGPHDFGQFLPNNGSASNLQSGARITQVLSGGPAEKAGLQAGDVILAVDGQELNADNTLADLIQSHKPGDTVQLNVQKAGATQASDMEVTLAENPDSSGKAYLGIYYTSGLNQGGRIPFFQQPGQKPGNGNNGQNPPFEFRPFKGTNPSLPDGVDQAVQVTEVISGTPAAEAGLQANDIITAVDGNTVSDAQALIDAIQSHKPGDKVTLTVYRSDQTTSLTIDVTLGENPERAGAAYMGVGIQSITAGLPAGHPPIVPMPTPNNNDSQVPSWPGGGDA